MGWPGLARALNDPRPPRVNGPPPGPLHHHVASPPSHAMVMPTHLLLVLCCRVLFPSNNPGPAAALRCSPRRPLRKSPPIGSSEDCTLSPNPQPGALDQPLAGLLQKKSISRPAGPLFSVRSPCGPGPTTACGEGVGRLRALRTSGVGRVLGRWRTGCAHAPSCVRHETATSTAGQSRRRLGALDEEGRKGEEVLMGGHLVSHRQGVRVVGSVGAGPKPTHPKHRV